MILLNISLPVEVWVNWEDHFVCRRVIGRLAQEYRRDDINCKILPTTTTSSSQSKSSHMGIAARKSFMCKFTALLSTSLTDVIFIDADNLPITSKVATLFDSEEYRATGAIIWPDIFGEKCRETQVRNKVVDPGITAWRSHCVLQAKMGGLKWDDTFPLAQEAETGQIVLNLRKHGALIEFAKVLMEHDFFRTVFYGDKDLFRYVFLLMEEPFYFVPHYPGLSVFLSDPSSVNSLRVDSLIQYFPSFTSASVSSTTQSNNGIPTRKPSEFEPYFFHQLKLRNPESFRKALLIAPEAHSKSSVCIQSTGCEIEVLDKMEHMLYRSLLLLSENSTSTLSRREFIRKRSLKATEIESSSSSSSSSSRSLQQTTELEKLYLQNLEKGEDYSHIAQQVFQKGDMDWHDIYTNSPWYRFALILHKIYGIFQAIYFQIDNYF